MKLKNLLALVLIVAVALIASPVNSPEPVDAQGPTVRISSKQFTESYLLAHFMAIPLQEAGYTVELFLDYGDTPTNREALVSGIMDGYPEYTGSALTNFYNEISWVDIPPEAVIDQNRSYALVSSLDASVFDMIWLEPAPANNTFGIVITPEFAAEYNLYTMEDFAAFINSGEGDAVYLATNEDFLLRPDALPAFEATYEFDLPGSQMYMINRAFPTLTQQAMVDGINGITASFAFSTDALIQEYGLVLLEDTLNAQPYFQPTPVFRGEVMRANPEINGLINPVFASLTNQVLQELNARVDVDGVDPYDVAYEYLESNYFIGDPPPEEESSEDEAAQ